MQTLLNEGAAVLGREAPEWKEHVPAADVGGPPVVLRKLWSSSSRLSLPSLSSRWSSREEPTSDDGGGGHRDDFHFALGARVHHESRGAGTVKELMDDGRTRVRFDSGEEHRYRPSSVHKLTSLDLLIVCAREESGGHLRLLQQEIGKGMGCEVIIGTDNLDTWRSEVERANRGVILLQTRSVLRDPVRLLQLYEATRRKHPLVCINVVGGGYDFDKVKPLLKSLPKELPQAAMATLRTELQENGYSLGKLSSSLSRWIPNASMPTGGSNPGRTGGRKTL